MFSLGYPGELWIEGLGALAVPIPGSEKSIMVTRYESTGEYAMLSGDDVVFCDNILMMAAVVLTTLRGKGG